MPRRFLTDIELLGFSLLNAKIHPISADPTGLGAGDEGRVWWNTTTNRLMVWDGTAAVDLLDLGAATGTLTASKVSDFTTAVRAASSVSQLTAPTTALAMNGQKITGLADGAAGSDAASYGQVLALINNQVYKAPVRVATTGNITLSAPQTIDGVAVIAGDRVLVKDQTTASTNGIYTVAAGAWVRATDADSAAELPPGAIVVVTEGATQADRLYMLATNGPIVIGTTSLTFSAYGASSGEIGVAGAGLTKTGTTYDVGAGTGITVAADSVAVDTAIVGRKVVGPIPTATAGIFTIAGAVVTINHGLANSSPIVAVHYGAGGTPVGARVEVDESVADPNNVTLTLPAAPAANQYIVTVVG